MMINQISSLDNPLAFYGFSLSLTNFDSFARFLPALGYYRAALDSGVERPLGFGWFAIGDMSFERG